MQNVKVSIDKAGVMTILIDLKAGVTRSASGKSDIIASTQGNKKFAHEGREVSVGLNVYRKVEG
jgi:hypothetical protein